MYIDRMIYQMFTVGCTDLVLHKYLGPVDPSDPNKALGVTSIQDVVFLENRDRKYDADIYTIRGHFQLQDLDFNLSQFALFLQNDNLFATVHINNTVDVLGRKIMAGDVIEIPVLKDEYALNDLSTALKRFYVVDSITRASEGYSVTWYPHLYKLKLVPIVDSQEFKDILNVPVGDDADNFNGDYVSGTTYYPGEIIRYNGELYVVKTDGSVPNTGTTVVPPDSTVWDVYGNSSLQDLMSTYNTEMAINNAVIAEAESYTKSSGYETRQFFTLTTDAKGTVSLVRADISLLDTTSMVSGMDAGSVYNSPTREGYTGYLLGDGLPPNGGMFGFGIYFPESPQDGDFFLRTDFLPNRLFRYDVNKWTMYEDSVRMTLTNTDLEDVKYRGLWSTSLTYYPNDAVTYEYKTYIASGTSYGSTAANLNQNPMLTTGFWTEYRQTLKTSFINNLNVTALEPIRSDSLQIVSNYVQDVTDTTNYTSAMVWISELVTITTTIAYDADYAAGAHVNSTPAAVSPLRNHNGFCQFDVMVPTKIGDSLRWTIFGTVINEAQGLSKTLRPRAKFGPQADL